MLDFSIIKDNFSFFLIYIVNRMKGDILIKKHINSIWNGRINEEKCYSIKGQLGRAVSHKLDQLLRALVGELNGQQAAIAACLHILQLHCSNFILHKYFDKNIYGQAKSNCKRSLSFKIAMSK